MRMNWIAMTVSVRLHHTTYKIHVHVVVLELRFKYVTAPIEALYLKLSHKTLSQVTVDGPREPRSNKSKFQ